MEPLFGLRETTGIAAVGANAAPTADRKPLAADQFFEDELVRLRDQLFTDPRLYLFRSLPDALLTYVCAEKMKLAMNSETRHVSDQTGQVITGYTHHYQCQDDPFHPKHFVPFPLKAYWIPTEEGELFALPKQAETSPFVRTVDGKTQFLFVVHPKSEALYAPLMAKHAAREVGLFALSLSSFRTLLVATPWASSKYSIIKVSLAETIGGAPRTLSRKECAASVAGTALLSQRGSPVALMPETLSFVPGPHLTNCTEDQRGAGMIYRGIPDCLTDPASRKRVMPLFSLFGKANQPMLDQLILQSGKTPTNFIVEDILRPICVAMVNMVFFRDTSLEIHGQNLLLVIDTATENQVSVDFLYRDMGGLAVSRPKPADLSRLPTQLQSEEFFYCNNYIVDASTMLEGFAVKVLFNLTKQFVKSGLYCEIDPAFQQWEEIMLRAGLLGNWTTPNAGDDAHQQELTPQTFCRYGYFEKLFGHLLLEEMSRQCLFFRLDSPNFSHEILSNKLGKVNDPSATCLSSQWFKELAQFALTQMKK